MENLYNIIYNNKKKKGEYVRIYTDIIKTMNNRPIGIFDSGIGGLTVLNEIRKKLPCEDIIYIGDTKNFPYGDKSKEDIIKFAIKNVERLIEKNVKIIVIACGTATSQAIDVLKKLFNIPIIGIIEPTVEYVKEHKYNKIGVIATEGTIRSGVWEQKLKEKICNIEVINKACPMLAKIAEEGRAQSKEGREVIKQYMLPLKKNNIDKIILGCTHFPVYEKIIKEEMGYEVELINTGKIVSEFLENYIKQNEKSKNIHDEHIRNICGIEKIYLTKYEENFEKVAETILDNKQFFISII